MKEGALGLQDNEQDITKPEIPCNYYYHKINIDSNHIKIVFPMKSSHITVMQRRARAFMRKPGAVLGAEAKLQEKFQRHCFGLLEVASGS